MCSNFAKHHKYSSTDSAWSLALTCESSAACVWKYFKGNIRIPAVDKPSCTDGRKTVCQIDLYYLGKHVNRMVVLLVQMDPGRNADKLRLVLASVP
jgi:hypothetical protein